MKPPVFIRVYRNDRLVEVKQFGEVQVVIGSGEMAQLKLTDPSVSAIHAMIEERDSGHFVSDLGSGTGTYKNATRVLDEALKSGDQIRVGEFVLEFFVGLPKPHAPAVTAPSPPRPPPVVPPAPQPPAPVVAPATPPVPRPQPAVPPPPPAALTPVPAAMPVSVSAPEVVSGASQTKSKKHRKTFAPPSAIGDLGAVLQNSRGNVIEVVTAWRERVLNTYHFSERKLVTLGGGAENDIVLPVFGASAKNYPLMRLDSAAIVFVRLDPGGVLRRGTQTQSFNELLAQNRLSAQQGGVYGLALEQGESVRIDFPNEIYVYVRYVSAAPKPLAAPFFDFTSTELTGFVMSFVLTAILGLYMALYTPPPPSQDQLEDQVVRTAVFVYKEQPKPPPPPPPPEAPKKVEKPIVREEKKPVKPQTDKPQGKAAEVMPKKSDKKLPKVLTSVKQGGEIKTGQKDGANAKSVEKRDVNKTGLLGVFGSKGAQTELDQAYSGAGELQGLANSATGTAGSSKNRPGEGLGAAIKDVGAGGKGTATVGIAGVGSNGSGFGRNGYGTGGLGEKKGTLVIPGGAEESFDSQIDREAIRRVVRQHIREVQYCYEKELNQDPNLAGKVLVTWQIGAGGRVIAASVTNSTLSRKAVGDCLVARLKTWRFPEPPADKEPNVTFPFLLQKN